MPRLAPLPSSGDQIPQTAQVTPSSPSARPGRTQAGATQRQSPAAARPSAAAQPRSPQAQAAQGRATQPGGAPAADAAQQIQFDRNGLVTMHTNELDVRQLLEYLSRRGGLNILVSPGVTGTVTANLEGVTVEQILEAIIKLANLVDKQEGTIHYIYSKEEVRDEAEFTKKERILTKVYKLSYVRADEILGVIRPFLSADVGRQRMSVTPSYRFGISESATFVSGGGQAMGPTSGGGGAAGGSVGGPGGGPTTGSGPTIGGYQPPTGGNSLADYDHLIIQDYESNLKIIDQIIQRIDVRPIQVLIEAVIISVDYEHDRELGVNLGLVDNLGNALGTIGPGTALNGNVGFTPTKLLTASGKIAAGTPADPTGFTGGTNGIKFGFVSNNVTGFIRALETIGSTKILASPRILVLNKQRAEIQLGTRLGFQTLSQNFTSTIQQVQFLNTGTLLRLRPFVSDDGMVRMEIHPERSSGFVNNNIPNQNTAELTTNVMVPDGATLVIGGLIEDEDDFNYQGLPGLSRLPALGFLTGFRQKTEGRRELVVLLTPHIWSVEQAMAHAPPAHPGSSAFSVSGPVANGPATTFDLETGRASATAPSGGDPAGVAGTAGSPLVQGPSSENPADPPASSPPAIAPLAGSPGAVQAGQNAMQPPAPVLASANPSASPANDHDPKNATDSRRRRWPSLRGWISQRTRDRQADPSANGEARPGVMAQASATAAMPQPASGPDPQAGTNAGPQPSATSSPPIQPASGPMPSPRQPNDPDGSRPNLDIGPPPAPAVGATMSRQRLRHDPMLAQAGWTPDRDDEARAEPQPAERPQTANEEPAATHGIPERSVVAGPRRHTIARGDTYASIARLYYGSEQYGEPLRQSNRGRIGRDGLQPGDLLVIPPIEELDVPGGWAVQGRSATVRESAPGASPERSGSARPRTGHRIETGDGRYSAWIDRRESSPERASNRRARQPRAMVHVVGPDETPRSIAQDRLGDARRANEIIELNRDQLATEGRWRAGLRILLPADAGPPREAR